MFEKYSALGAGARAEPSSPYQFEERRMVFYGGPREEEKGVAVSPLARAMVEYPLEEERGVAAMVEYPLEEERVAVSPLARAMLGHPLEEERGVAVSPLARAMLGHPLEEERGVAAMVEYPLEEERVAVSPLARAMLGHPLEEERGVAVSRAMVGYPLEEERGVAVSRAMVGYPLEEERGRVGSAIGVGVYQVGEAGRLLEATREFKMMRHLISKFKLTWNLEPEEILELLKIKEYAKKWNKEEGIKEIEGIKRLYETMKGRIIFKFIFKVEWGDLEPEEMLESLRIKKYAKETGKKDWLLNIEEIERKYYMDVPSPHMWLEHVKQKRTLTIREAEDMLRKFKESISKVGLDPIYNKLFMYELQIRIRI